MIRAALAASTTATVPSGPTVSGQLGRVNLVVPVRPESIAWLDQVSPVCGWTREQAARQALSEGRRALTLELASKPDSGRPTPTLRVVPEEAVLAADEPENAPTPA